MPSSAVVTHRKLQVDVSFVRTSTARCPIDGYHRAGPNLLRGTYAVHLEGSVRPSEEPVEDWPTADWP
jgi:hypothetical protein